MNAPTTSTPGEKFRGWFRPTKRHRWQKLSEADDYGDALNQLLDRVAEMRTTFAEVLVSKSDPNNETRARKRRRK